MELLSPAGSFEKLKYAVYYGADAVYTAGEQFGLRAKSINLSQKELKQAVEFCHQNNVKLYIAVNIFAHNTDIAILPKYLKFLQEISVDAIIISDPAIFSLAQNYAPLIPIHISTQANVTSWKSAEFWFKLGAKRIILARELSIYEVKKIKTEIPEIELEIFAHGAMCMSYSGRCLLSSFLNSRDANRGNCSQPCRWQYSLIEESRPGEYFPIEEDSKGTYILNSKDLCLFDKLLEIIHTGINSIKIEGRMKSLYYVANVTRTYKTAITDLKNRKKPSYNLKKELDKVSHRVYTEGFFEKFDSSFSQHYESSSYIRNYQFIGKILQQKGKTIHIEVKAKFSLNDELEIIFPEIKKDIKFKVKNIRKEDDEPLNFTKPNTIVKIDLDQKIPLHGIIRKKLI